MPRVLVRREGESSRTGSVLDSGENWSHVRNDDHVTSARAALGSVPTAIQAEVVMELPLAEMVDRFGPWSRGATAETATSTRWPIGGDTVQDMLYAIGWIPVGVEYRIEGNDELAAFIGELAGGMRLTPSS